jgi:hypothetical protein
VGFLESLCWLKLLTCSDKFLEVSAFCGGMAWHSVLQLSLVTFSSFTEHKWHEVYLTVGT